jgi:hypothetical protein
MGRIVYAYINQTKIREEPIKYMEYAFCMMPYKYRKKSFSYKKSCCVYQISKKLAFTCLLFSIV